MARRLLFDGALIELGQLPLEAPPSGASSGSGEVTGVGSLVGAGSVIKSGAGEITAVGSLAGSGLSVRSGSGEVSGVGSQVGAGRTVKSGAGDVGGIGSLVGEGEAPATVSQGSGTVDGVGSLVGAGAVVTSGSGSVDAVGSLVGEGDAPSTASEGSGTVDGAGSLIGAGSVAKSGSGIIGGVGELIGAGPASEVVEGPKSSAGGKSRAGRVIGYAPPESKKKKAKKAEVIQLPIKKEPDDYKPVEPIGSFIQRAATAYVDQNPYEFVTSAVAMVLEVLDPMQDLKPLVDKLIAEASAAKSVAEEAKMIAQEKILRQLEKEEAQKLSQSELESLLLLMVVE